MAPRFLAFVMFLTACSCLAEDHLSLRDRVGINIAPARFISWQDFKQRSALADDGGLTVGRLDVAELMLLAERGHTPSLSLTAPAMDLGLVSLGTRSLRDLALKRQAGLARVEGMKKQCGKANWARANWRAGIARWIGRSWILAAGMAMAGCAVVHGAQGAALGDLSRVHVDDLAGHEVKLKFGQEVKAVVFLFVSVECPISNNYAPEFRRLGAEFGPQKVQFELVYPNVDETGQAIRNHVKEFHLPFEALRDVRHELVGAAGARVTPEAAVLARGRGWVYRGRIDNRYADLGVARPEATEHELRDVLTAIVQNKAMPKREARAIGCSIAPLPGSEAIPKP